MKVKQYLFRSVRLQIVIARQCLLIVSTWYCTDGQDKQCFMIEFIHNIWWLDMFPTSMVHPQERFQSCMLQIWYVVFCVLLHTSRYYAVVGRTAVSPAVKWPGCESDHLLYLLPNVRMREAIPPLPTYLSDSCLRRETCWFLYRPCVAVYVCIPLFHIFQQLVDFHVFLLEAMPLHEPVHRIFIRFRVFTMVIDQMVVSSGGSRSRSS